MSLTSSACVDARPAHMRGGPRKVIVKSSAASDFPLSLGSSVSGETLTGAPIVVRKSTYCFSLDGVRSFIEDKYLPGCRSLSKVSFPFSNAISQSIASALSFPLFQSSSIPAFRFGAGLPSITYSLLETSPNVAILPCPD